MTTQKPNDKNEYILQTTVENTELEAIQYLLCLYLLEPCAGEEEPSVQEVSEETMAKGEVVEEEPARILLHLPHKGMATRTQVCNRDQRWDRISVLRSVLRERERGRSIFFFVEEEGDGLPFALQGVREYASNQAEYPHLLVRKLLLVGSNESYLDSTLPSDVHISSSCNRMNQEDPECWARLERIVLAPRLVQQA